MKKKIANFYKLIKQIKRLNSKSVLVYQMGKVGSSSIEKELIRHGVDVMHTHKISNSDVHFYEPEIIDKLKRFRIKIMHFFVSRLVKKKKCKIITIVRDPLDRTLSQMFHHIDLLIYNHNKDDTRKEESTYDLFKSILLNDVNINYSDEWMKGEFNASIGGDYLDYDFNKKLGYGFIETSKKEILILRFEDLGGLSNVIGAFVGVDGFQLSYSNRAAHKWYGDLYKNFKKELEVSDDVFDGIYETPYFEHFYGDVVRQKKKDQWVKCI